MAFPLLPTPARVRTGYDRWAEVYDVESNPLIGLEAPVFAGALGDVSGLSALDLGCGTGRHTVLLAAGGASVTGVDFSPGMLEAARRKPGAEQVTFLAHDMHEPLPFPDASFNLVVSGLVLEHLRDLDTFFGQACRVLRPGGRAIFTGMHPAMFLRGVQAHFYDPRTGEQVAPGSVPHGVGDFVMAILRAGLALTSVIERAPDEAFAAQYPRAHKYVGWPLLVMFEAGKAGG